MPARLYPSLSLPDLASAAKAATAVKRPPIAQWHPSETMDSRIRITADGAWLHEGSPIPRLEMVQLFASILTKDSTGQHWLVTPECRQSVEVDDTAFVAVDVEEAGDVLLFRLNTGERVAAGPDAPLVVSENAGQPRACLHLPYGCEARLNRSTWSQLVDLALSRGTTCIASGGARFELNPEA